MEKYKSQEFNILADNLPFLITRHDRGGRCLCANLPVTKSSGFPVRHFIGKTGSELNIPDELMQLWLHNISEVFETKAARAFSFSYPNALEQRYFETKLIPEMGNSGEVETILGITANITEQVLLEKELRESEERYHSIFQSSQDGIFLTIPDGTILDANDAVCTMLGHSREELLRLGRAGVIAPNEDRLAAAIRERGRKGYFRTELNCIRSDGSIFPAVMSSTLFFDKNGEQRTVIVLTDISEMKAAEDAQYRLQEKFTNLLESISDAFVSINAEWKYTYANDHALQLLRRKRDDLIGKIIWEEFPDAVTGDIYRTCLRVLKEQKHYSVEQYNADMNRWFENRVFPAKDGLTIFFQDITKRKEVEESLRNNEELSRLAIKAADIWVFNQDTELRYTWAQNTLMKSSGVDIIGKTDAEFLQPDDAAKLMDIKRHVMKSGSHAHDEIAIFNGEGLRIYEFFYEPLRNEAGIICGVIGAMLDVTTRKQTETDLLNSREQLHLLASHLQEVREEERIKLSRELHDDLGQTLTGLKMDLAVLAKRLGSNDESARAMITDKIENMSRQIDTMVKSVRRIATDLRPNVLDYFGLVAAIELEADEFGKRSGIPCIFRSSVSKVNLEPMQATAVFRILQEALTNVVRHAKATEVHLALQQDKTALLFTIHDNGIGIESENISAIHSIGILGMKERALLLGGKFEITGKQGEGTMIILTIPINGEGHV